MSINFEDQSEYSNDMEELDDLQDKHAGARVSQDGSDNEAEVSAGFFDDELVLEEDEGPKRPVVPEPKHTADGGSGNHGFPPEAIAFFR